MCSAENHMYFLDFENNALILRCHRCRCKWRIKRKLHNSILAIILVLSVVMVIAGILTKLRILIPLGITMSSLVGQLDYKVFLVLKHVNLNWERVKGEQIAFDHE